MSDKAKIIAAATAFAAGVLGYYFLADRGGLLWLASLGAGVVLGAGIYITTGQFIQFRQFVREARTELSRVVWPARQETIQTTAVVIAMVLFVGAFLWLVDWVVFSAVRAVMG